MIHQSVEIHARGHDGNSPVGHASRSGAAQPERSDSECHQLEYNRSYVLMNNLSSIS